MNTYVKDNLIDLDRRTTQTSAKVATSQTTTSLTYTDLATTGPAVTVTIGANGKAEATIYGSMQNSVAGSVAYIGFAVSGATTVAAADDSAIANTSSATNEGLICGCTVPVISLNSGSNTFTAKYKAGISGTATFVNRRIIITPLGS